MSDRREKKNNKKKKKKHPLSDAKTANLGKHFFSQTSMSQCLSKYYTNGVSEGLCIYANEA